MWSQSSYSFSHLQPGNFIRSNPVSEMEEKSTFEAKLSRERSAQVVVEQLRCNTKHTELWSPWRFIYSACMPGECGSRALLIPRLQDCLTALLCYSSQTGAAVLWPQERFQSWLGRRCVKSLHIVQQVRTGLQSHGKSNSTNLYFQCEIV